jgi:hypothetical protein
MRPQADKLVAAQHLLQKLSAPFRFGKAAISGTHVASKDVKTQKRKIDGWTFR